MSRKLGVTRGQIPFTHDRLMALDSIKLMKKLGFEIVKR